MKRFILIAIACMMVFTLTACNLNIGNLLSGGDTTVSGATGDGGNPSGENTVDTGTLNGFLSQFGLTENDLKPAEHFASFEYQVTDGKSYQGVVTVNMDWGELANDGTQKKAAVGKWMKQVYDKMVAISDDGKAYTPYTTEEYVLKDGVLVAQWAIYYKQTNYWVTLSCEGGSIAYFTIVFN